MTDRHTRRRPDAALDQIWYTRCPVPTASGLAHNLGWLAEAFGADGLEVGVLQDGPPELARHHFDHQLVGLFREGGNVPALAARAEGAPTRLIGLTWIDEWQSILVRAGFAASPAPPELRGARSRCRRWAETRGAQLPARDGAARRQGRAGARRAHPRRRHVRRGRPADASAGARRGRRAPTVLSGSTRWPPARSTRCTSRAPAPPRRRSEHRRRGRRGPRRHPDRAYRVNNGTPRPITVHAAAPRRAPRPGGRASSSQTPARRRLGGRQPRRRCARILQARDRVRRPGRRPPPTGDGFHRRCTPTCPTSGSALLEQQKHFLLAHGFLAADFDLDSWVAPEPLAAARGAGAPGERA